MSNRDSIFDSIAFLAIIGILAGAIGGLGVGLVSKSTPASTNTSSAH